MTFLAVLFFTVWCENNCTSWLIFARCLTLTHMIETALLITWGYVKMWTTKETHFKAFSPNSFQQILRRGELSDWLLRQAVEKGLSSSLATALRQKLCHNCGFWSVYDMIHDVVILVWHGSRGDICYNKSFLSSAALCILPKQNIIKPHSHHISHSRW